MNLEGFALSMAAICSHCRVQPDLPLRYAIVANPKAGGFTISRRWKTHEAALSQAEERARALPPREASPVGSIREEPLGEYGLFLTGRRGHAGELMEKMLHEAAENRDSPFYLVICAGGDGTSLEVLNALYHAPEELRKSFAVLRLPMGTGNDGADRPTLEEALELLLKPTEISWSRAVTLKTSRESQGPFLAFNILSVGLDAFVTHMTNRMKGNLPGDSYRLWVDIAALLYDRIYTVGEMDLKVILEGGAEEQFRDKPLLLAMGVSGHRTYGSQKHILPDDRNLCMVRQMPLIKKLFIKGLFNTGAHVDKPEARLWSARGLEFTTENDILAQMDGETVLLRGGTYPRGDFPARISLTEPAIPLLKIREP